MFYIIAYDTPSNKRRRKMAKAIKAYARRVQKSVYESCIDRNEYIKMVEAIEKLIDDREDNVRIYNVPKDAIDGITVYGPLPLIDMSDFEYD